MKTKITTIGLLGMMLFSLSGFIIGAKPVRNKTNEPAGCLTISGKVLNAEKGLRKKITVYLIQENATVDSIKTNTNLVFSFQLKKDRGYSLRIVEPGSVTRLISISTYMPGKLKNNLLFRFHFDLLPFTAPVNFSPDSEILDFPLALIYYNPQKACFEHSKKYTEKIKEAYNQEIFEIANN